MAVTTAIVGVLLLASCGGGDETSEHGVGDAATAPTSTAAAPAPSAAEVGLDAKVTITPERVGTADRPEPVRMAVDLRVRSDDEAGPVQNVALTVPSGVRFQPDGVPECSAAVLDQDGPEACPRGSRIGTGTVSAGAEGFSVEGAVTVFFGGDDRIALWVSIDNPVVVGVPIAGRLVEQSEGGYRLALEIPSELQDVAGVPVALERLRLSLNRGGVFATTDCPDGGLPFAATLGFDGGASAETKVAAACR